MIIYDYLFIYSPSPGSPYRWFTAKYPSKKSSPLPICSKIANTNKKTKKKKQKNKETNKDAGQNTTCAVRTEKPSVSSHFRRGFAIPARRKTLRSCRTFRPNPTQRLQQARRVTHRTHKVLAIGRGATVGCSAKNIIASRDSPKSTAERGQKKRRGIAKGNGGRFIKLTAD